MKSIEDVTPGVRIPSPFRTAERWLQRTKKAVGRNAQRLLFCDCFRLSRGYSAIILTLLIIPLIPSHELLSLLIKAAWEICIIL